MSEDAPRPLGADLARLDGYPFAVRHSDGPGAGARARIAADIAVDARAYFSGLFSGVHPDIALLVLDGRDWPRGAAAPYGLPYFNDDPGQIAPGIIVMSAGGGEFWTAIADDLGHADPQARQRLRSAYPDGEGGVDLQPFFDLVTIHELGHAFEVLGDLRLPTDWLSEIFVNLAMHAFVAERLPESLHTLEVLPSVGAGSRRLAARWRAEGCSTLEELDAHYTGGDTPMDPLNYVWYQCRWQRLAAQIHDADGEAALARLWACFHARDRVDRDAARADAASLVPLLTREVSGMLGRAIADWR